MTSRAELTPYYARDRRVYNGALCSDMEREEAHIKALDLRMKQAHPEARAVYFPAEGKFLVFIGIRMLTCTFHECQQRAMIEAIRILEEGQPWTTTNSPSL